MLLVVIFIYDGVHLEIPELFLWLILAISAIVTLFSGNNLSDILLGGLVGGGFLGLLVGISGEKWMGSGDIMIGLAFGLLTGLRSSVLFLFLAFSLGAIFGLILIAIRGKKIKSEIAFAPFLIIAGIIALLWGDRLINLYLNFVII
jgi:prepilin signal peptidase PulO-like enzyme (type II secretory pathway)